MSNKKSKYEDKVFASAKRMKAKVAYEEKKFAFEVPYTNKIDVALTTKSKKKIYIELKGGNSWKYFDSTYRKKWKHMYAQHKDEYDIRLLFEKNFKIGKVWTVSTWCEKLGVKYYIGSSIPKEWLDE